MGVKVAERTKTITTQAEVSEDAKRRFAAGEFEGPLDLLWFLIHKSEINIYDIPIAQITEQYLEYLDYAAQTDLGDLSEFYKWAAMLLNMKSRMLLPVEIEYDEEDVEDPRQELVDKLIEYQKFKKLSELMEEKENTAEWNYERNNGLTPMDVLPNSNKMVWWKCSKGHEWYARINGRSGENGCPYCSGRYAIKGKNDLQTVNPTLAKEWNYDKNNRLTPMDVLPNSNKKVWWICSEGHEWQSTIANRNNGNGCPYCSGRHAIKGENDLQAVNPNLANEWNYEKNNGLLPQDMMSNSNKMVWWICSKGHEWQSTIANRNKGNGCPICNSERKTSFPEYALVYYLQQSGLEVVHSYRGKGYELDIYIPSLKIAIEYDGYYWHKHRTKKDLEKNYKCKKDGIKLYRIREGMLPLNDSSIDYVVLENQKNLSKVLKEILSEIIGTCVNIDIETDAVAIESLRVFTEKENSLLFSNSEVAKEWNYEKNGNLKPEHFAPNSHKKVWWKCGKGHEWQAAIANRNKGRKCPYCSGKKVLKGYNDLQTVNPTLALEWNYEKNNGLTPAEVTPNSNKKVWWKCSEGHEWETTINNRSNGNGCPICRKNKGKK